MFRFKSSGARLVINIVLEKLFFISSLSRADCGSCGINYISSIPSVVKTMPSANLRCVSFFAVMPFTFMSIFMDACSKTVMNHSP